MATETPGETPEAGRGQLLRRAKGALFEAVLVGATLVGVLALLALFALVGLDALGLSEASPSWYLGYFGVLVAPVGLYTLYVRRRPAVAAVNARAFGVTFGALFFSLVAYAVAEALEPTDVAVYCLGLFAPPAAIVGYARWRGESRLAGPAVPLSMLVGLLAVAGVHGPLSSRLEPLADWTVSLAVVTLPVAGVLGVVVGRRTRVRYGLAGGALVTVFGVAAAQVGPAAGVDSSLALVATTGVAVTVGGRLVGTVTDWERGTALGLAGAVFGFAVYAAAETFGQTDVVIYGAFVLGPFLAILGYARRYSDPGPDTRTVGPVPVELAGIALLWVPVGVATVVGVYGPVSAALEPLLDWLLYLVFVTVPAAGVLGLVVARRWTARYGVITAGLVGVLGFTAAQTGPMIGVDPSLALVLASAFLAPVGVLTADTVVGDTDGRVGLLGPLVLGGGIVLGVTVESQYGLAGPDTWLNPTLLLNSWSGFRPEQAGIYPPLVGSIIIVGLMTALAFPVGVGAAIYLEEYAPESGPWATLATALDVNISNLAGVPSVVYGLLGLALFQQALGLYPGLVVAGSVTLGLLILPIVIVASQEALRSVPDEFREASYALGASRWQTVRSVVLPEAFPGVLTGTILAVGRAIGETAPLVMLSFATTTFSVPDGLLSDGTALPLQIFAARAKNIPEYRTGVVAAAAIVLLALMLLLNATAILLRNRYQREDQG